MRALSTTEQFMQIMTIESNRDQFMIINTSTLPEWEQAEAGFELIGGGPMWQPAEWITVHKIRYEGSMGAPNQWKL